MRVGSVDIEWDGWIRSTNICCMLLSRSRKVKCGLVNGISLITGPCAFRRGRLSDSCG